MGLLTERLKGVSSRAGKLALGGALAVALTPALAFATDLQGQDLEAQSELSAQHYDYKNNTGKVLSDTLNGKVKRVDSTNDDHVYQYMGYVHSDGSHYSPYSLYTEITTDANGIVTALDITSANDMWTGKWGYMTDAVEGYLPDGVGFTAIQNSDGTWSPALAGIDDYNVTGPTVTLISTNAAGTTDALGVDQNADGTRTIGSGRNAAKAPKYTSNSGKIESGKISIPTTVEGIVTSDSAGAATGKVENADYYNLVKCSYVFALKGNDDDKVTFNTYFTVGEYATAADQYIDDVIGDTEWKDASYNTTNRDGWTGLTGTLALRMLGSWNACLQDSSVSTDLDGELTSVDTVSGATKTSRVFVEALNQAKTDGFVKGVSENVQVAIDKGDANTPEIAVNSNSQDGTTVVKNTDGTYTVNALHRRYGGGRLSLLNVYVYDLSDETVGTVGMKELAKDAYYDKGAAGGEGAYEYLKSYNTTDLTTTAPDKVSKMVAFGSKQEEATTVPIVANGDTVYGVGDSDDYIALTYTNDGASAGNMMPIALTTKSPAVTHVVFKYLLGHATFSMAYDLEEMSRVSGVSELLESLGDSSNVDSVAQARAAYNSLTYDVRPFATGLDKLIEAEKNITASDYADKVAAAEKSIQAHTIKAVELAPNSFTFTGQEQKPEIKSVTAEDGSVIDSANYTIAYNNNVDAGDAYVTVMGKGDYSGSASASFKIAQAEQTISAASASLSKTFGDAAFDLGVTASAGADVTYASSKDKVATVDANGKVTIVAPGSAEITATVNPSKNFSNTASTTVKLTVNKAAQSISVSKSVSKTFGNAAFNLGAKLTKGDGKLSYSTSNAKVAAVDAGGKVTIKGAGSAVITVKAAGTDNYNAASAKATVKVAQAANKVTLKKATKKVALKKVKKKAQTVAIAKATAAKGAPAATYSIAKALKGKKSAKKSFSIDKKTGKITVKKGTAKGAYKVTVKAASGNANYKTASATAVITINVK